MFENSNPLNSLIDQDAMKYIAFKNFSF